MYFDQLLPAARQVHVVYSDQLLGAAHYIHFIWMNYSLDTFKVKCKNLFLKWEACKNGTMISMNMDKFIS